jgi:hypothetical protein
MSDQRQTDGSPTPSGPSAVGFASSEPESTSVRGASPAAGETSATAEEIATALDTAGVEENPTSTETSARRLPTASSPTQVSTGEHGDDASAQGEAPATRRSAATSDGPASVPTAESHGVGESRSAAAPETRGDRDDEAASGAEPATGTRSNGGIRAWASRIGLGVAATASGEGQAGEGQAGEGQAGEGQAGEARAGEASGTAATATAPGGDSPNGDAGAPGHPKKPMLAGAAMAGAILVAVPLLVMAISKDDDDSKKVASSSSADTVLGDDGSKAGAFVAESPSPNGSKDKEKDPSSPSETADDSTGTGPGPSAEEGAEKKEGAKKKEGGKTSGKEDGGKKKTKSAPRAANALPAILTQTLIKNNTNKTCVDIPGHTKTDGEIHQSRCTNSTSDNQLWTARKMYKSAGPGGAPLFVIRNVKAGVCLDLPGYKGVGKGERVSQYPCQGTTSDNQLWWLDKQSDGRFWIRNVASDNMCLDSYEPRSAERTLFIWPCASEKSNNHEWIFTRS